jgi:small-conductance mechanosensitive channel
MYLVSVIVLLILAPAVSVVAELVTASVAPDLIGLIGTWMTFWAVGVRLFTAGVKQTAQPSFTARDIFQIDDPRALGLVREIGFGNLAMGLLGLASFLKPEWLVPAAIVGGLYYGLAGLGHLFKGGRNTKENVAMLTDFLAFVVLAIFVVMRGLY